MAGAEAALGCIDLGGLSRLTVTCLADIGGLVTGVRLRREAATELTGVRGWDTGARFLRPGNSET